MYSAGRENPKTVFEFSSIDYHSSAFYKMFACPRYTPAVMFYLEGISKFYTLLIVSFVCSETYGLKGLDVFTGQKEEIALLIMVITQVCYEVGQLASSGWSLKEYFGAVWNMLDFASCALLVVWAVLSPVRAQFPIAKIAVGLSAIPLALLQLQYLSLIKQLGLLVIMIQSMIFDVQTFFVVYLVFIWGFVVFFRMLFSDVYPDYSSSAAAFTTLFSATVGQFTYQDFYQSYYQTIATIMLILYIVMTNILLINLLIAQMSSTYDRIFTKSREEWAFIKVSQLHSYIIYCSSF